MSLSPNGSNLQYLYGNKVARVHRSCFLFYHLWISNAAAVKHGCNGFCWEHTFIILDQNLLCIGVGMRILKLELALLSETLVLVLLMPGMGVLIAAILHKLSIEFPPQCAFSRARTVVTLNEMTVSFHSLFPCCPSAHFSPPWSSHLPFFLSLSSLSFASVEDK